MNTSDILDQLMPLFQKKLELSIEKERMIQNGAFITPEQKNDVRKTDLEYKKLEAQITNDKDKLKWEKEKLTTAIKGDYDIQFLKNTGMLDTERLKGLNEKEKQTIMEEGLNSRAKLSSDTETNKAYLTTLGTILGHAQVATSPDGTTRKPTEEVGTAARSLMVQTGLAKPAPARTVAGEAEVAAGILREHEKAGTAGAARNYVNSLSPDVRAETLKLLNPGNATPAPAPGAGALPVAPTTDTRPPLAAGQSAGLALEPVRSVVQPVIPAAAPVVEARPTLVPSTPVVAPASGVVSPSIARSPVTPTIPAINPVRSPLPEGNIFRKAGRVLGTVAGGVKVVQDNLQELISESPHRALVGVGLAAKETAKAAGNVLTGVADPTPEEASFEVSKKRALQKARGLGPGGVSGDF